MRLPRVKQMIFDCLQHGRRKTADEIIGCVWQLYPQDAPQRACIKTHVYQINKIVGRRLIASIPGQRRDGQLRYRIIRR